MFKPLSHHPTPNKANTVSISLLLTGIMAATYGFGVYLFPLILVDIKTELAISYAEIALIAGISQMGYMIGSFLCSLFSSKLSSSTIILGSALFSGICLLTLALVSNIWLICLLLLMLRAFSALVWVPMVTIVSQQIIFNHRSTVLSIASGGGNYGIFLNGLLCIYLLPLSGWRSIWVVTGIVTLCIVLGSYLYFRNMNLHQIPSHTKKSKSETSSTPNFSFFAPTTISLLIIIFLSGLIFIPFLTYLIPYLREDLNFSAQFSGSVWSIIGFIGMGSGIILGIIADRIGIKKVLFFVSVSASVSALLLCFTDQKSLVLLSSVLFAFICSAIFGLPSAYIAKVYSPKKMTAFSGFANFAMGLGMMLGNYFGGWIKSISGSFFIFYLCIAISVLLLIPLILILPNEKSKYLPAI